MPTVFHWIARSVFFPRSFATGSRGDHASFERVDGASLELDECRQSTTLSFMRGHAPIQGLPHWHAHEDFVETLPANHLLSGNLPNATRPLAGMQAS